MIVLVGLLGLGWYFNCEVIVLDLIGMMIVQVIKVLVKKYLCLGNIIWEIFLLVVKNWIVIVDGVSKVCYGCEVNVILFNGMKKWIMDDLVGNDY